LNGTLLAFRLASAALPRLSRRNVDRIGDIVGWLCWRLGSRARLAVQSNLRVVLGRVPTDDEVCRVFRTAARNYCDLFYLPRLTGSELFASVDVEGWEHLESALAGGRGALLASLHLGNLEMIGYAMTTRGARVMLPVERIEPPEFLALMVRAREKAGFICEPVGTGALTAIRATLRGNAVVGVGVDRITLGDGELVRFCGRPARMPLAAALLALRTKAPLLPIGSYRRPGQRYCLRIGEPITLIAADKKGDAAVELTERLLATLETFLRADPTQWVMFRSVWSNSARDAMIA